jgi:hypothetical protein
MGGERGNPLRNVKQRELCSAIQAMTGAKQNLSAFRASVLVSIAVGICVPVLAARAQSNADRALQSVNAERTAQGWVVMLRFSVPLRYVRHSPRGTASPVEPRVSRSLSFKPWAWGEPRIPLPRDERSCVRSKAKAGLR